MPQAPTLSSDTQAQQSAATSGTNPMNFLIAAADMHAQGQLRGDVPKGTDPLAPALSRKPSRKRIQLIK
jgi:hypothetical protein